ncbi:hypothetical protein GCM10010405_27670 [Streptomyces macrosporus]|uniref:Transposase n=1 Tax=Streptomyces macrosporus TaxID=44032 RepID=A0ABN3JZS2_9ACTN
MSTTAGPPPVVVTLAEIARIAWVGRTAVSNWRRRYDNFPSPVGGTDTSPQFSLPQVEEWLRRENKLETALSPLDRLWPEYKSLGNRNTTGLLMAQVGLRKSGVKAGGPTAGPLLDQRQTRLLNALSSWQSRTRSTGPLTSSWSGGFGRTRGRSRRLRCSWPDSWPKPQP